jgi:hypothetical protein
MLDEALRNLRLDRRLLERRGWITRDERERALAQLPDVSGKVLPIEEREGPASEGAPTPSES